ncbi:MAG: N-acetylmuramoyl-L-alanine amidase LytC [Candidatus Dichloromethanomonas elyunquensis]|nr:MAG: N-acetylmuramoyl-L-alanine amidase LytC [Candidatus Dichloromethanomonas elyunquensis]
MSRTKKIAVLAIIAMVLTMLPIQLFAATTAADSTRLFGNSRVETALQVCDAGWTSATTVIIAAADQENLVDALAAASLAGQENAPILLTSKASLDAAVKAKISALGAKKVYAVGALSDSVKSELSAMSGVTVEALKGDNRYDTAKAINAKLVAPAGTFVVGSGALADALSVSAFAAANKYAIVLAGSDGKIPAGQTALGSKTYLVGGSALVADIAGATRIAGADRFETNKAVLQTLSFEYTKVYVANGFNEHLVDSLVAAPLAAQIKAAIVLADNSGIAAKDIVNSKLTSTSTVVALGGTGVVSDSVRDNVKYSAPAAFAVSDVEVVGLGQVKVTFNQEVNETNAETMSNYTIGTTALTGTGAAVRQSDKKTVLVTFDGAGAGVGQIPAQGTKWTFKVASGILNAVGDQTNAKFEKELTFSDSTAPKVVSVTPTGNKKVSVTFSEPVMMTTLGTGIKIDGVAHTAAGSGTLAVNNGVAGTSGDEAATQAGAVVWANKLVIPFNAALSVGSHTLTVPAGTAGTDYVDAAGFRVEETTMNFTIDAVTGNPTIKEITAQDNGTVKVLFDRIMDVTAGGTNSVLLAANYSVNTAGTNPGLPSKIDNRDDYIKLPFAAISAGSNTLIIDKDIKDAWGNKLSDGSDDIRVSFEATKDTTKPTITSINLTGNEATGAIITVKFSEDVSGTFASNANSYKLRNASGDVVASVAADYASILNSVGTTADKDTWVLTLVAGKSPLTDASYSLEVKDIVDLASTPNRIDTIVTNFTVGDTVKPTVSTAYESSTTANKVMVVFSEAMSASVNELANYYYIQVNGEVKALPSGTTISRESDKIVSIKFPNGVVVNPAGAATDIKWIRVANVSDVAGNTIAGASYDQLIAAAGAAPKITITASSVVVSKVGDDIWVQFETSEPLSTVSTAEVTFGGVVADTYVISGKQVTLKYLLSTGNVAGVKAVGSSATAILVASTTGAVGGAAPAATMNVEGRLLAAYNTAALAIPVYDDQVAPEVSNIAMAGSNVINITFSEQINAGLVGLYKDDFTFDCNGTLLTAPTPTVTGAGNNILTFTWATPFPAETVNVRAVADKISVVDMKTDVAETENIYVPTTANKGNNLVTAAGPYIVSAALTTDDGSADGNFSKIGDVMTITYSRAVTVTTAGGAIAVGASDATATAANISSITGTVITYGVGSTVTVAHPTANTVTLTIGATNLTAGVAGGALVPGTAGGAGVIVGAAAPVNMIVSVETL